MTTVEILFHYSGQPSESSVFALASAREVYGIRHLAFDRAERTLLVEYDATRLNAAMVTQLVRRSGLELDEEFALVPELEELPPEAVVVVSPSSPANTGIPPKA